MTNPGLETGPGVDHRARWVRFRDEPVDASLLAFIRIAVGAVLTWELWRYLDLDLPHVEYDVAPLHFTYWPLDWIQPPPPWALTVLFVGLSLAAALVAVGAFFRPACLVLWAGMTYIFLLDRAYYLNHWYLACLLLFLLAFTPANAMWSVDARADPTARRATVPGWTIWILRFQIGIVYLYSGLCKLDRDWLTGGPLRIWLRNKTDFPVIGRWFDRPGTAVAMAVAALVFDLSLVGLMAWRPSRRFAYPVALGFHLMNSRLFAIGMFPWLMMMLTTVFFPADFPRRMIDDLRAGRRRVPVAAGGVVMGVLCAWIPSAASVVTVMIGATAGAVAGYHLGGDVGVDGADVQPIRSEDGDPAPERDPATERDPAPRMSRPMRWFLVGWIVVQIALPLRPYLYSGDPSWTEEGQQFAWRLLVRTKSGTVTFRIRDPDTGSETVVDPDRYLSGGQLNNLAEQPDMIVHFAHWIEQVLSPSHGGRDLEVRATTSVSLNGRPRRPLIDPDVDLSRVSRRWSTDVWWVLPERGR